MSALVAQLDRCQEAWHAIRERSSKDGLIGELSGVARLTCDREDEQVTEPELVIIGGGWLRVAWPDRPGHRVLVLTAEQDGRRVVRDLVMRSLERVSSTDLKGLPIGWLEGVINIEENARALAAETDDANRLGLALTEVELLVQEMTSKPAGHVAAGRPKRPPLKRPDGQDPDFFYRGVAEAYTDTLRRTSAIAPALAEEAGVPVATVRRWIQEARRRGFLPPARRGRAG
jgi:hypothetical protein